MRTLSADYVVNFLSPSAAKYVDKKAYKILSFKIRKWILQVGRNETDFKRYRLDNFFASKLFFVMLSTNKMLLANERARRGLLHIQLFSWPISISQSNNNITIGYTQVQFRQTSSR